MTAMRSSTFRVTSLGTLLALPLLLGCEVFIGSDVAESGSAIGAMDTQPGPAAAGSAAPAAPAQPGQPAPTEPAGPGTDPDAFSDPNLSHTPDPDGEPPPFMTGGGDVEAVEPEPEPPWDGPCPSLPVELLHVAEAGTGAFSGCAPRTCAGVNLAELEAAGPSELVRSELAPYTGCTVIEGDLLVSEHPRADLRELACLERVTGTVVIWNSPALRTLDGLEALAEVGGGFELGLHASLTIANEGLLDFDALENLRAVGGRLAVSGGDALQRFGALPALEIVGGEVFFEFFRGVEELAGLNALRYVGGGFNLWRPEGLRRVTGLQSLETIAQYFLVWGATDLVELNGLPSLACIGEYVDIGGSASWETNPVLRKVHAFPALRRTTDLYLEWNPQLEEFEMFRDVEQVGSLLVTNNPRLTSLPLDRLSSADSFQVNDNPLLSECGLHEAAMRAQGTVDPAGFFNNLPCP